MFTFKYKRIPVPFPAAAVQLPSEFPRYWFQVHEVAEAASGALSAGRKTRKGLKVAWLAFGGAVP